MASRLVHDHGLDNRTALHVDMLRRSSQSRQGPRRTLMTFWQWFLGHPYGMTSREYYGEWVPSPALLASGVLVFFGECALIGWILR